MTDIDFGAALKRLGVEDSIVLPRPIYVFPKDYIEFAEDAFACVKSPWQSVINGPLNVVDVGRGPLSFEALSCMVRSVRITETIRGQCHYVGHPATFVTFFNDIGKFEHPLVTADFQCGLIEFEDIPWRSKDDMLKDSVLLMHGKKALAAIVNIGE